MFRGNLIRTINRAFCHAKGLFFFPPSLERLKSAVDNGLRRLPFEAFCWLTGLLALACMDTSRTHFTLCPLRNAGFDFCPGCGLGRSVSLLFHGEISASLHAHPLGIFAVIVLSLRIINLTKQHLQSYGKSYRCPP
ncbi:MAG TPA: DUF2752 domain-containing protein [Chryseosolibacter sp.]